MGRFYFLILSIGFISFFTSCKKDQFVPSYVYIPQVSVSSNYSISGSNSSAIDYVKVFTDNQLTGVYQLPINVPILKDGQSTIKCSALIENNGLASNLIPYPFYELSTNTILLESNNTDTIYPVVSYVSSAFVDYWFEDFDGVNIELSPGANSNAPLLITENPADVFQGSGSGKFDLSSDTAYSKYLTEQNFDYSNGKPAFVELNYKNNQAFFFSLILRPQDGNLYKVPLYQFKSSLNEEGELVWTKIYIDIGTTLNGLNNFGSFDVCLEMERDVNVSDPIVLIDNLKVIKSK